VTAVVKRIVVRGRVQGVGYRFALADCARELGVCGWVANRHDGTVEAVVAGDAEAVAQVIAWSRSGPPAAHVSGVDVAPAEGSFTTFEIAATF
jgi:acylphosphatase